ncbi:unnamed protein product [Prunus armeniaca]|uniref:Uncharacterized protein n=1 Tax=Prunus armeniaca TaxID=36596 RepID=A0A6J5UXZ1_PRUAR|nr:unnamed protein product [Prunus armeniaca]
MIASLTPFSVRIYYDIAVRRLTDPFNLIKPFGRENIVVVRFGKGFGEKVSHLINGWNVANPVAAQGHLFTDEVIIELDMSGACVKNRIGRQVSCADIVTVKMDLELELDTKFNQKV